MTKNLELKLVSEFSDIFRDYGANPNESCMAWGIDTDDGWFDLIRDLCLKLEAIRKIAGLQVIANQVKEKYGSLVFLLHHRVFPRLGSGDEPPLVGDH